MTLKYLLVLDFEATCDESKFPRREMEIIEFPTILYDFSQDKVQATFHEYVRPLLHPTLTSFCTGLTGIKQETVDAADPFPQVWARFREFMISHNLPSEPSSYAFVACGDWDLKTMLPLQLSLSAPDLPAPHMENMCNRWINIKTEFRKQYGMNGKGMAGMLHRLRLKLEGRHHSGIDDCRNILRILQRMRADGWEPPHSLG
ncbi:hypothetical protein JAAARDRAFT_29695 [Jaapia argillacea MUCL 33604]|uniref:Exonuclease domain-containing protein n=1 Tax=Jaapia argillacea MUCL 33604 TaxID=933084 RepID=A0A067Q9N0_9AGAM|nr:hypothetical protein JAAARDRAFT_29695 [Jaapia argillacea MUCL 33604]